MALSENTNIPATGEVKRGRGRPPKNPVAVAVASPNKSGASKRYLNRTGLIVLVVILLAAVPSILLYKQNQDNKKKLNALQNSSNAASNDVTTLTKQVSKHALLPNNEQPVVRAISTQAELDSTKGPSFFKDAAIGDKVLIYNQTKKLILYRPSIDKIIAIGTFETTPQ